jgi:serine/threonine protein kinase
MSNADDETIRHRKPAAPAGSPTDATRIAPPRNAVQKPKDDATRIAPPKASAPRSAPAADAGAAADATRYRPPVRDTGDGGSTRVAPPGRAASPAPPAAPAPPVAPATATGGLKAGLLKNRFVLEKTLGAGGMGVVYKAKDLLKVEAQDKEPYVAIKVLSEEFKAHPNSFIALQRESRTSHRIAHPNIVNVHDFDRDGDTVYMTMEYMEGQSLDRMIRQYKSTGLPSEDTWRILKGMCAALMHAHGEKIIHSDFKPGNVFVTTKGTAKVFDFGIARAVAKAHQHEEHKDDRTVFDAGTLGALTPAYASLEMLEGRPPDVQDDIYALGCVIYEMFTGEHPYQKAPADEAERLNLKPARIPQLSKHQWKALEKALAFRREDRIESVEELLKRMTAVHAPAYKAMTIVVLLAIIAAGSVYVFMRPAPALISTDDIRNELEQELRIDFEKQALADLLKTPEFSPGWEEQVANKITALRKLLPEKDSWLRSTVASIYGMYLDRIASARNGGDYVTAARLIKSAYTYTTDPERLEQETAMLEEAIARDKQRHQELAVQRREDAADRTKQKEQATKQRSEFDIAMQNVNDQLACAGKLNMRNVSTAVEKLRNVDAARYAQLEGRIVGALASCIVSIGKSFPESAQDSKKYAMRVFPGNAVIAGIAIVARDPCDGALAGLGARNDRSTCRDRVTGIGNGPELVVVPGGGGVSAFAIGKYEVSVRELNQFCAQSGACKADESRDPELPATTVPIATAEAYVKWLSSRTDRRYRLPSVGEWEHAARGGSGAMDANRNCKVSTRGITRGLGLLSTVAGRQNDWGLVNHVGNAQEWAWGKGKVLMAMGGSYEQSLDRCTTATRVAHDGNADATTGFRVVRELVR